MVNALAKAAVSCVLWEADHALTELEMCRAAEAFFLLLGLPTWGADRVLQLRPSVAVKEPEFGEAPSIALFVLGAEYYVFRSGPGEGVYFVVDPSSMITPVGTVDNEVAESSATKKRQPRDAPGSVPDWPFFPTLPEALTHVLEHSRAKAEAMLQSEEALSEGE